MVDMVSIISFIETAFTQPPGDIDFLSRLDTLSISDTSLRKHEILVLWKSSKCICETNNNRNLHAMRLLATSANIVVESSKGETTEETDICLSYRKYAQLLKLKPNVDKLAPTQRIERLIDPTLDSNIGDLRLKACYKLNILRAVKGSPPSAAPGIKRNIRCFGMARQTFFPFSENADKPGSEHFPHE